jgi:FixJ family two-component response regulator
MPGQLNSRDLRRKAQRKLPGLPLLFTSGYTDNAISHSKRLDHGVDLLSKPFTREDLARKLRLMLDRNPRPTPERIDTA